VSTDAGMVPGPGVAGLRLHRWSDRAVVGVAVAGFASGFGLIVLGAVAGAGGRFALAGQLIDPPGGGAGGHWTRRLRVVQCAAWPAVASQPSRCDIACAQLTTARTWPESSAARHRTDHG
jgi:hypothetical protein